MVVDICRDYIKSNEEKGRQIFVDFLEFIIDGYLIVGNSENYKYADTETLVKVSELRNYIKHSFIEKLLIHFVKTVGAEHLTNVELKAESRLSTKIKGCRCSRLKTIDQLFNILDMRKNKWMISTCSVQVIIARLSSQLLRQWYFSFYSIENWINKINWV